MRMEMGGGFRGGIVYKMYVLKNVINYSAFNTYFKFQYKK